MARENLTSEEISYRVTDLDTRMNRARAKDDPCITITTSELRELTDAVRQLQEENAALRRRKCHKPHAPDALTVTEVDSDETPTKAECLCCGHTKLLNDF